MAAITLLEAGKLMEPSRKAGVIQTYAEAYQPMRVAPIINTEGKASYSWSVEDDLARNTAASVRNVNADYTASQGDIKPYESDVKIYGGKIQVDDYIVDHSPASVTFQEQSQIRSHAKALTVDIFEGDGGTHLRGWRNWLLNDAAFSGQDIAAGTTASGDLLTTPMVDELEGRVDRGPNLTFYCREIVARRLRVISKGQATGEQRMTYEKNEFGMWAEMYDGIPIVILQDGKGTDLLSVTEIDGASTNSDTCSLYLINWGIEAAALFSSSPVIGANGVPLPKLKVQNDGSNYQYERLEWYIGNVPHTIRSIGRIKHIKNATS